MNIDPNLITLMVALLALMMPWLYDGSLFTPERVSQRGVKRTERKRQRYTESEIQAIRDKARRGL